MKKFEYKVVKITTYEQLMNEYDIEATLKKLGSEGWRLIKIVSDLFVFEREIVDD